MIRQPIRAVAFDIDGTLYPNGAMYRASLPFALRNVGLLRAFARARRTIRLMRPVDDLRAEQARLVARDLRLDVSIAKTLIENRIYTEWERLLERVAPFPAVRETIERLRAAGFATAALSDFPVERKLALLGLDGLWDVAFSAEDVHYLKPNPEPFLELAARLQLDPGAILYVGNSHRYDVCGARAAGMRTAHLSRRRYSHPSPDLTFWRFAELETWVRAQND